MDDKNLIQAVRLFLKNRDIKKVKKVELYRKGTIDMISFVDHLDRVVTFEVTIHHDSRESRCIK
jgi:hypothetical protein